MSSVWKEELSPGQCQLTGRNTGWPVGWTDPLVFRPLIPHNLGGIMQHKPAASWKAGEKHFNGFAHTGLSHNPVNDHHYLF